MAIMCTCAHISLCIIMLMLSNRERDWKRKLPRIISALRRGLIEAVYLTLVKSSTLTCLLDYTTKLALPTDT